ncbi:MAG: protein O-mannosyl-transferase family, partial [Polyangiales bacterium]
MRRTTALTLAAGVPCVVYLLTASGGGYWLDGGEFVEAAVNLDIAHPPGHPLTGLYGKAWTLLPLGSLAFRMALGQA